MSKGLNALFYAKKSRFRDENVCLVCEFVLKNVNLVTNQFYASCVIARVGLRSLNLFEGTKQSIKQSLIKRLLQWTFLAQPILIVSQ